MTAKPRKTTAPTRRTCADCGTYLDAPGVTEDPQKRGICTDCTATYGGWARSMGLPG